MIGVDEVGRGCWAGPLVVAAAQIKSELPQGLKDSKKLTAKRRQELLPLIKTSCRVGIGWVWPDEIDKLGLSQSLTLGGSRALSLLSLHSNEQILLDGSHNYLEKDFTMVTCVVGGDNLVSLISAASIAAKQARDEYMVFISHKFENYSFHQHVGYGTAKHLQALKRYGPIVGLHRMSFKPVGALAQ